MNFYQNLSNEVFESFLKFDAKKNIELNPIINQIKEDYHSNHRVDIIVKNFICTDWNTYYNLYNPENFEDPENRPKWYDPSLVYEYYKKPRTSNTEVTIYSNDGIAGLDTFAELYKNAQTIEQKMLEALVHYTFRNGGAYAAGKHYDYAKKTMEQLHQTKMTDGEFIKRNLCLDTIRLMKNPGQLSLYFDCGWDGEHGLDLLLNNNEVVKIG